jgi:hypothetical protein
MALASPAEEPDDGNIPILESAQELLGFNLNRVANQLDMFFADQRADDELGRSRIRVRRIYEVRERELLRDETQLRFNIRLPSLEEKFKFEFKNSNQKKKKNAPANSSNSSLDPNRLDTRWQFRSDIGVVASVPPQTFARTRMRKNWEAFGLIHRFVEELAWYSNDVWSIKEGWEEITFVDSDYSIQENLLFRFRNLADWKITAHKFTTSHGPSILHRFTENDALSYATNLSSTVDNGVWYVSNYRLGVTYRRNLYKQWLYSDLTPGLDFPKMWHFRRTPFILLQIEALFGGR